MKKREHFKIDGNKIERQRKHCPKCGPGVFLADHKNRFSCGKCGYTEFKGDVKKDNNKKIENEEPQKPQSLEKKENIGNNEKEEK